MGWKYIVDIVEIKLNPTQETVFYGNVKTFHDLLCYMIRDVSETTKADHKVRFYIKQN